MPRFAQRVVIGVALLSSAALFYMLLRRAPPEAGASAERHAISPSKHQPVPVTAALREVRKAPATPPVSLDEQGGAGDAPPAAAIAAAAAAAAAATTPAAKRDGPPSSFAVEFVTSKGSFVVHSELAWAPQGVARLYELVQSGFFNGEGGLAMFRTVKGFVSQFGIHGDPSVSQQWSGKRIPDDKVVESNKKGFLSFAAAGPNTRTTQMFFNLVDNTRLDGMGFAPIAQCVSHCDVLDKINTEYGEQPNQGLIHQQGNAYLKKSFPNLDYILSAKITEEKT